MFRIYESNVKITKVKEVSDKLIVGVTYTTHKDGNNFIKTFIETKIVGNALKEFKKLGIKDKDKFTIVSAVIKNEPYKNQYGSITNKCVITIFELKKFEITEENN